MLDQYYPRTTSPSAGCMTTIASHSNIINSCQAQVLQVAIHLEFYGLLENKAALTNFSDSLNACYTNLAANRRYFTGGKVHRLIFNIFRDDIDSDLNCFMELGAFTSASVYTVSRSRHVEKCKVPTYVVIEKNMARSTPQAMLLYVQRSGGRV